MPTRSFAPGECDCVPIDRFRRPLDGPSLGCREGAPHDLRSINVDCEFSPPLTPTATQPDGPTHATPESWLNVEPAGLGTDTGDQLVPFQCSSNAFVTLFTT